MRGGSERRPDVRNVELGDSKVSSVGWDRLVRETIGREDEGEENISWLTLIGSIVVDRTRSLSKAAGRFNNLSRPEY